MAAELAQTDNQAGLFVLAAASLVAAVLGSVHAFSVFLTPLEQAFQASRSLVSLTYSLALISLTIAVLFGPRIFGWVSAGRFVLIVCLLAAGGALFAGRATALWHVWAGYSLIFGAANGLGYGFGLQIAARANPNREGLAMGVVTAAYALGSIIAPLLFEIAVGAGGFRAAMIGLAAALGAIGAISALIFHLAQTQTSFPSAQPGDAAAPAREQLLLWLGYLGGVLAGLMVIGHAAGIAAATRPDIALWLAPVVIAVFNLIGSLIGGRLSDKAPLGLLLSALPLMTVMGAIALLSFASAAGLLIALAVIGFAYGGTIAAYPAAIAKLYGIAGSPRIYGRVFTAWGTAGLFGPWLAGWLFDVNGDYQIALVMAATCGIVSAAAAIWLSKISRPGRQLS